MKNSSGEVNVDFCFRRAGRVLLAAGALVLIPSFVTVSTAHARNQAAAQPNWKDRDEYDLFTKITQTTDPKARLELMKTWDDKYPNTEMINYRLQYYVETYRQLAGTDPSMRQPLLNKCGDLLKLSPKDGNCLFYVVLYGPIQGGASPSADLTAQVESAAHTLVGSDSELFAADKKPQGVSDDQWKQVRLARLSKAHLALAWSANTKKDAATAESEYREALTVYPDDGPTASQFGKMLFEQKKYSESLFEYARAGQYSGPGASLPPAGRQQALDFFNKTYKQYHGSDDGKDQVLTQAKSSALPPAGFHIVSQEETAKADADNLQKRIDSDPAFKLWYGVKSQLIADGGPAYFTSQVKDAELPGGAGGVKTFSGTILSLDPADKPTKVTVGIEDPAKADATLIFTTAIPAAALTKIKVGEKVDFTGVVDSFNKDPYMLTFKDPEIPGVQLAAPPPRPKGKKK